MLNKLLKKYAKNEKGLTLIELLVVIVILGIIAAIAVVSIGGIITKTKEKAAVTEAVQIINAAKLAHSTEGSATSWNQTALSQYVSNTKDKEWTVSLVSGEYKITGHEDALKAVKVKITSQTDPITESVLTNYLGGE
ncbi:MAG: type IV pilin protein [Bacillota bacterium]